MALIRDNLEYDHHMRYDRGNDREMFEGYGNQNHKYPVVSDHGTL